MRRDGPIYLAYLENLVLLLLEERARGGKGPFDKIEGHGEYFMPYNIREAILNAKAKSVHVTPEMRKIAADNGGPSYYDEWIQLAIAEYGAWHLPTLKDEYNRIQLVIAEYAACRLLKDECRRIMADLQKLYPNGGDAWEIAARMNFVIALRERGLC